MAHIEISDKIPGCYTRGLDGVATFVPDPLPKRALPLQPATRTLVGEARYYLGQAEMCHLVLRDPSVLINGSLKLESLASSTIEGTIASPNELLKAQVSHQYPREAILEVANHEASLRWGYEQIQTRPLAGSIILGLHDILLRGVRGKGPIGQFKTQQNAIADAGQTFQSATYYPPDPLVTPDLMRDLEEYIAYPNKEEDPLVQVALVHYQFESIHPFADGNGRVGRVIILLHMIKLGILSTPLIYPSVSIERHKNEYYDSLQRVRTHGDWDGWVGYFARMVILAAKDTIKLTETLVRLKDHLSAELPSVKRRASTMPVIEALFQAPVISIPEVASQANITYNTAQSVIEELETAGIVVEITGQRRSRMY